MINQQRGFWSSIPPVTKNLIIINTIVWLATFLFPDKIGETAFKYLALHYWGASDFNPAQLITYMFFHDNQGLMHLFFNMFSLFIFGKVLEQVWGGKRFLFYYLSTGLGAAIVQELTWMLSWQDGFALQDPATGMAVMHGKEAVSYALQQGMNINLYLNQMITIGASGAVFGILLAFGMMFPNAPMYLFFIPVPIKAKYIVIGYGLLELFFGFGGIQQGVAHFAHLGGMAFGLIILLIWKKRGILGGNYF